MTYLGHVIFSDGVAMDQQKAQAVADWPLPRTVQTVHGFLRLVGYYRKFIHDFESLVKITFLYRNHMIFYLLTGSKYIFQERPLYPFIK